MNHDPDDARRIFSTFTNFLVAARELGKLASAQPNRPELFIPIETLDAFTVELGLKCLAAIKNVPIPKKHDVVVLFDLLPQDEQDAIRRAFDVLNAPLMENVTRLFRQTMPNHQTIAVDFTSELGRMRNVFVDWRYFHEPKQKQAAAFLPVMVDVLRERIAANRPDLNTVMTPWTMQPFRIQNAGCPCDSGKAFKDCHGQGTDS